MNVECAAHPIDHLAERARAGERRAAAALMDAMRPYSSYIRRLSLALRTDPDEAMSLLGLAITLALRSWDPARGHFATWTLWQARGLLTAQRPTPPMESWEERCEHQDPYTGEEDDAGESSPEKDLARRILDETPEFLRAWLHLRVLQDHSQHQAAEALGLSHRQAMLMDLHLRRYFQRWEKEKVLL